MKKIILALFVGLLMSTTAQADIINGIEFSIPEEWTLSKTDEGDMTINYYTYGEDIVSICVQDVSNLPEGSDAIVNSFLMDCENVYSEKEGFYLMSDDQRETDGLKTLIQDCVFIDDDEWHYVFIGSRNWGKYTVSVVYYTPTFSARLAFPGYCTQLIDHIFTGNVFD